MEFKRARSEEQFLQRKQEIINCAIQIYEESGYEEMNFSRISEITNFTRPTIYKYFKTKEEVMLKLVIKYMDEMIGYVVKENEILEEKSSKNVANILTRAILIVPNFMNSYSILYSVLEKNVSVESLAEFKKEVSSRQNILAEEIKKFFPNTTEHEIHDFLVKFFAFASGLYPMSQKTENQKQADKEAGIDSCNISFKTYFQPIVHSMLEEMEA